MKCLHDWKLLSASERTCTCGELQRRCEGCKGEVWLKVPTHAKSPARHDWLAPGIRDPIPDPDAILARDKYWVPSTDWTWLLRPEVSKAYVDALLHLAKIEVSPPECEGEGLVICGGDTSRFDYDFMAAVSCRLARRHGYNGPIERWFDPETERVNRWHYRDLGDVRFRSFAELPLKHRVYSGWWEKIVALIYSKFRYALLLDADASLIRSPKPLFDAVRQASFLIWRKFDRPAYRWIQLHLGGEHGVLPMQGGHVVVDRREHWRTLLMAQFITQHSSIYFDTNSGHPQNLDNQYGEEDSYQEAFIAQRLAGLKPKFTVLTDTDWHVWHNKGHRLVLTPRLDGKPIIQHRITDKLSPWNWEPHSSLPGEADLKCEVDAMRVHAPVGWTFRPGDWDARIFDEVCKRNEYRMPEQFEPGDLVLDVGGHIGSAAFCAYERGSRNIHSVEPHPDNFALFKKNMAGRANVQNIALWAGDPPANAQLSPWPGGNNTGAATLVSDGGIPVSVKDFDTWVFECSESRRVRFLKLDCERAEIPILLKTTMLDRIDEIAAELHTDKRWDEIATPIVSRLNAAGFSVELVESAPEMGQGLLFARRRGR